ncbi:MAG: orotidine-5'-phosphate decarboxylase [Cyanobacteria bacterium]|nr:orotidine-5'-phosphate decarboxylase [Cyanobacteriota bacterium]
MSQPNPRIFVALDVPTAEEALQLVSSLQHLPLHYKVGMQLFYQEGLPLVQAIQAKTGKTVFVDLKLHDIPTTVANAAEVLLKNGVCFFNCHCMGGLEMMQTLAKRVRTVSESLTLPEKPTVLGVTVLTSMDEAALKRDLQVGQTSEDYVVSLARMAQDAGLSGVVCSAREVAALRAACGNDFVLLTPGIRLDSGDHQDQKRVMTPIQALQNGASDLVIGRPITHAADPVLAAEDIIASLGAIEL